MLRDLNCCEVLALAEEAAEFCSRKLNMDVTNTFLTPQLQSEYINFAISLSLNVEIRVPQIE